MNSQGSTVIVFLGLITLGVYVATCFPQYFTARTYQANGQVILKSKKRNFSTQLHAYQSQKKPVFVESVEWVASSHDEVPKVAVVNSSNQRPECLTWYIVKKGDTQWAVASRYSKHSDKKHWLKSMRWVSRKGVGDTSMNIGESVCIEWAASI